eukprot:scaffold289839_cov23-Tisochrysis_lutea.AAC.2
MHVRAHAHTQVDSTLACFDTLSAQHKDVSQKSKALYNSCEQLVKEKDQLAEFADAIRVKLKFFDEFETVYSQESACRLAKRKLWVKDGRVGWPAQDLKHGRSCILAACPIEPADDAMAH